MSEVVLKPCPCCGDETPGYSEIDMAFGDSRDPWPRMRTFVMCNTCGLCCDSIDTENPVEVWNNRPDLSKKLNRDLIMEIAEKSGFKACPGNTDKSGNYQPDANAFGHDVPIEWIEKFASLLVSHLQCDEGK